MLSTRRNNCYGLHWGTEDGDATTVVREGWKPSDTFVAIMVVGMAVCCAWRGPDSGWLRLVEHKLRGHLGRRRGRPVPKKRNQRGSSLPRERTRAHGADRRRYCDGRDVRHDDGGSALAGRRSRHHRKLRQLASVSFGGAAGYSNRGRPQK